MPCYITAILLVYTAMERHMCFTVVIVMYLLLLSFLLLVDDPVDPSCFWLIDVRPLVRVSAPGVYLLVALLLCTVNPSCLLHFRLLSPALCFSSIISPTAAVPYIARRQSSLWYRGHSRQYHFRGPCSGGQCNGGGYQGWDNKFLRSSRRPSSYQDIQSPCTLENPELSTSRS